MSKNSPQDLASATMLEQAQLLADYIRSPEQNDSIVLNILNEQIGRNENSVQHKLKDITAQFLSIKYHTKDAGDAMIKDDANKLVPTSGALQNCISPSDLDTIMKQLQIGSIRGRIMTGRDTLEKVAHDLLTAILKADNKNLSALDGGTKTYDEVYQELSTALAKRISNPKFSKSINLVNWEADIALAETKHDNTQLHNAVSYLNGTGNTLDFVSNTPANEMSDNLQEIAVTNKEITVTKRELQKQQNHVQRIIDGKKAAEKGCFTMHEL